MKDLTRTWSIKIALLGVASLLLISVALVSKMGDSEARTYDFNLLYAILHDDAHGPLPPEEIYARRLARLETVIERESFGRIMVSPRLHFIHARRLARLARETGDERLAYSNRSIEDWIPLLEEYCTRNGISYDILVFCPASEKYGPWCTDGPSQGYSYQAEGIRGK